MAGIRLEWAQFGDFDSFDVLRSDSPMDINALPSPIATGLPTMFYADTAGEEGATYYYRVVAWRDGISKVSGEIQVKAQAGDEHWNNVVGLLNFDESLTDQTGRIWTANSSPAFAAGKFNKALQLSGNALYTPYNSDFDWSTNDFTIECFVKASSWASFSVPGLVNGIPMLIGRMGQSNDINQWSFGPVASGKLHFYYFSSRQNLLIASSGTVPVNAWVHIAFCKDATNAYVAIDGVVTSAALPASITL